ncbi:MAG TPA: hypothetical protein VGG04_01440 [Candidatus Sulfotelmatobacter sp.]
MIIGIIGIVGKSGIAVEVRNRRGCRGSRWMSGAAVDLGDRRGTRESSWMSGIAVEERPFRAASSAFKEIGL